MLKKILIICIFLSFSKIFCQNNQGRAIYTVNLVEVEDKNALDKNSLLDGMNDFTAQYTFTVEFNENVSHCYSTQKKDLDLDSEDKIMLFIRKSMLGINEEFYYNKDKLYEDKMLNGRKYLIVDNDMSSKWKLTNETKQIGLYKCRKAVKYVTIKSTNKQFELEAWYTTSIPLPYGPKWFVGLPGLVIEAKRGSFVYQLKKITFNPRKKLKKIKIPTDDKYKVISKENFDKLNMELRDNYIKMRN